MCLTTATAEPSRTDRVNVVLILSDDQGYNSLSCAGQTDVPTPHLDRLAEQGVRLTQCYTPSPVCSPTRAALLTGNYPQRISREFDWVVGGLGASNGLPPATPTLASMLKSSGYTTGIMGKWHLGGVLEKWPTRFGFDEFKGFVGGNLDYWAHDDSDHQPDLWDGQRPLKAEGYLTDLTTDWSIDFIRRHKDRPFFLYVAYNAVHWPYQARAESMRNLDREPGGNLEKWCIGGGTPEIYQSMLRALDQGVGRIAAALDAAGLADRTLVIFTSDNGGDRPFASNKPFRGWKCELYEGGIRVPCIFRWPGRLRPRSVFDQPIITMDLTASILAACGVARDPRALPPDGMDILPLLAGRMPPQPRRFFWYAQPPGPGAPPWRAVRDGDLKLVQIGNEQHVFDLKLDPSEQHDLAGEELQRTRNLKSIHTEWEKSLPAHPDPESNFERS
jgi:arylsulfatase A-like enzyme